MTPERHPVRRRDEAPARSCGGHVQDLQQLFSDLPDGVVVHDQDHVLMANDAAARMVGAGDGASLEGVALDSVVAEEHRDWSRSVRRRVLDGTDERSDVEVLLRRADGSRLAAQIVTVGSAWRGRGVLVSTVRDVTRVRRDREELAESRQRLSLALSAARDGVWDWDLTTDRVVYNEAWARIVGLDVAQGGTARSVWSAIVHPEDLPLVEDRLSAHFRGEAPHYEAEIRLRHRDGREVWVLDRGRIVARDGDGRPTRVTGIHRDITAEKRAAAAAHARESLAEIFLAELRADVWPAILERLCAALAGGAGLLVWRQEDELLSVAAAHGIAEPESPALISPVPAPLAAALAGEALILDAPLQLPGLGCGAGEAVLAPLAAGSHGNGVVVVAVPRRSFRSEDLELLASLTRYLAPLLQTYLTARSKDRQLLHSQKLEALGALAGGIAHDFNNILQAIVGFTDLALGDLPPDERAAEDLRKASRAAVRGRDLVDRILHFSRREEQRFEPLDLSAAVTETLALLRSATPADIKLEATIDPGVRVVGDRAQLVQAVLNLASNSLQAMELGGGELGLRLAADGGFAVLEVTDTGPGLSANVAARAFDPFFTTREVGRGSGLGLSATHGIVTAHGGDISIANRDGGGTLARVTLPLEHREPAAAPAETASARVLLADDDPDVAELAGRVLQRAGHVVTVLSDGAETWRLLQRDPDAWDLVIVDQAMPGMPGAELAGKARELYPELPVAIVTGNRNLVDPAAASGALRRLVEKPFTVDELLGIVAEMLDPSGGAERPER